MQLTRSNDTQNAVCPKFHKNISRNFSFFRVCLRTRRTKKDRCFLFLDRASNSRRLFNSKKVFKWMQMSLPLLRSNQKFKSKSELELIKNDRLSVCTGNWWNFFTSFDNDSWPKPKIFEGLNLKLISRPKEMMKFQFWGRKAISQLLISWPFTALKFAALKSSAVPN